ncbi:MAG: amidohydrolase family protein [Desulfomonilaceae bacterium]
MIIDSHCHIFTERIVSNTTAKPSMVVDLRLNTTGAYDRLQPESLQESLEKSGIEKALLLPTAGPQRVVDVNNRFIEISSKCSRLGTLATLHPLMRGMEDEIQRVFDLGITGFKFSSFSQRFDILSSESDKMLTEIFRSANSRNIRPKVVLDTFVAADVYFGARPEHLSTPAKLSRIVVRHQGIDFICAHMGGLLAKFDELRDLLRPNHNLYLDTSNAVHTLKTDEFTELLRIHGASHVLFGTDWPWFLHEEELARIVALLTNADFSESEQARVLGENARDLCGL